jgi:peptide/nickel transport system substrate-binding protein
MWSAQPQSRGAREQQQQARQEETMRLSHAWLVSAALFGAGCVAAAPPAMAQAGGAKGSLTVAFAAEPTTADPVRYAAGVDTYVIGNVFEQLLRYDPDGKQINWLAESWKLAGTADKPVIEVALRPGVLFQNGDPMTADDLAFSYERFRDPKQSRWSHLQASVEQFEVVDPLHIRIHFKEPDANYITDSLQLWAMPRRYFEKVGADGFARAPIGTGPWKLTQWKPKEEMDLEAFDGYWNKQARPGVKTLVVKFIPEDLTRVAAYKTGAIDWMDAVPPASVAEFRTMANTSTVTMVSGNNLFFDFDADVAGSPFRDVRVRQAAAYAIDMDAIISKVLFGQGVRYAEIGKGSAGYNPALKPYPYDPKKARELLRAAGYANGFDTPCYNLITPREPNVKEMGEAAFAYLTAAGIRCQNRELEYGAWINLGRRGRNGPPVMDGVISWMWGQGVPGDPGTPWAGHLHSFEAGKGWGSYSHVEDAAIDALVEQQKRTMDPTARAAVLRDIAQKKHDAVLGGLTTYQPLVTFAWRTDKVAFTPWPMGFWRNFQQIDLKR